MSTLEIYVIMLDYIL